MNNQYVKFAFIYFAFLMSNTISFYVGIFYFNANESILSLAGVTAIIGVVLANCATVQLLLAGKHHKQQLFYFGLLPTVGFLISFLLLKNTLYTTIAMSIYSLSLIIGILLLGITLVKIYPYTKKPPLDE